MNSSGNPVSKTHQGHTYLVIDEYIKTFSQFERITHFVVGILALLVAILSLGQLISFRSAVDLFRKQENIYYFEELQNTKTRGEHEETIYINPKILDLGDKRVYLPNQQELYFALIYSNGKTKIQPILKTEKETEYKTYGFETLDALLAASINDPKTLFELIKVLSKTEPSLLQTVSTLFASKRPDDGLPVICHLSRETQLEFLNNFSGPKEDHLITRIKEKVQCPEKCQQASVVAPDFEIDTLQE